MIEDGRFKSIYNLRKPFIGTEKLENLLGVKWYPAVSELNRPSLCITPYGIGIKADDITANEPAITCITKDVYKIDVYIRSYILPNQRGGLVLRVQNQFGDSDCYLGGYITVPSATSDHNIFKRVSGTWINLAYESIDLTNTYYDCLFSVSGSTLKSSRDGGVTYQLSVTDTDIGTPGYIGLRHSGIPDHPTFIPISYGDPLSNLKPALIIIEQYITGEGTDEDPIRPDFTTDIHDHPEFGKIDKLTVTWGAFDYKDDQTILCVIKGGNPYNDKAIETQILYAKSRSNIVVKPPKDVKSAEELYVKLKREFPNWIAGKHDFAYQCLGYADLEPLSVADFYDGAMEGYYGKDPFRNVPEWELERTIMRWKERLKRSNVLSELKDKHEKKLNRVLKQ